MLRRRTLLRVALELAVTAAAIGVLLWRGSLSELAGAFRVAGWRWVLIAAPLGWLSLVVHAVRWWLLMRRAGARVPFRVALRLLLAGGAVGVLVPLRAGAALQLQVLHHRYGVSRAVTAGTLVAEAILDAIAVVALALAAVPLLGSTGDAVRRALLPIGVALVVAGAVALAVRVRPEAWLRPLPRRMQGPVERIVRQLAHGLVALRSPRSTALLLLLTLGIWLLSAVAYGVIGRAFHLGAPPVAYLAVEIVVNVTAALPLTQANIGTYELAVRETLVSFGVNGDQAVAFAVAAHVAIIVGTVFVGLIAAWLLRLERRDVFYLSDAPDVVAVESGPGGER